MTGTSGPSGPRRAPVATYRVQLHAGFGFDDAAAIVAYLAELGVSHLYCSPYLQAMPGSTHGYDVVDHSRVNEELGGTEAHARLTAALREHGLGQVVDVVPNHMSVGTHASRWWWDVLENGPASRFADHFDVDWDPPESKLRNQVLVPVLGDHYGRVLEAGDLRLARHGPRFVIEYFEHRFPVAPPTLDGILRAAGLRRGSPTLAFLADAYGDLPIATTRDRARLERRDRDKEVLALLLERLLSESPATAEAIDDTVGAVNRDHQALHELLERQNYRLAAWRTGTQELDYRRFFDVATLAGLRVEAPHVFEAVHELVLGWYRAGDVDGLRIDHPDGLRDPTGYLERLAHDAPDAWIVVEKILAADEALPDSWPVAGTTGYDFLDEVAGLYVDPSGEAAMTAAYTGFTGLTETYEEVAGRAKRDTLRRVLAADVARLAEQFRRVCERELRYRDFTRAELRRGLEAMLLAFGVYRTYVRVGPDGPEVSDEDERRVGEALGRARQLDEALDTELLEFLADVLLLRIDGAEATELALRFQQLSGPTMAKGVEDTAFYRYLRLVSLNEVGGEPDRYGRTPESFHLANTEAARRWPRRMVASSTHDTKRSEDVRARIGLLSERAAQWGDTVERWARLNDRHRLGELPDAATEYLLYQTLVGAHPLGPERAVAYLEKAVREAKVRTSWLDPDPDYEAAVRRFAEAVLADDEFVAEVDRFVAELAGAARISSLAQLVLKTTSPGIPDIYQGCELWTDSLVDPDNRRPVDYALRRELLAALGDDLPDVPSDERGISKLFVTRGLLALRACRPASFAGAYTPLYATGPASDHAVGFQRGDEVVVCVPRLVLALSDRGGWRGTTFELPPGRWTNVFTGESATGRVLLDDALQRFPVAVWESAAG